jgi:hypothetical protein
MDILRTLPPVRVLYLKNVPIDDSILAQQRDLEWLEVVRDLIYGEETESFFAGGILESTQNHCKHLKSLRFRLQPHELLPCLVYISHHQPTVLHLTLDIGIPRNDPNWEWNRASSEDLDACLKIFQTMASFQISLQRESQALKVKIGLSVCTSLPANRRSIAWVLADRQYSMETKLQGDELYAIAVPAALNPDVLNAQQTMESLQRYPYKQLDPSMTKITKLGYLNFEGSGEVIMRARDQRGG